MWIVQNSMITVLLKCKHNPNGLWGSKKLLHQYLQVNNAVWTEITTQSERSAESQTKRHILKSLMTMNVTWSGNRKALLCVHWKCESGLDMTVSLCV